RLFCHPEATRRGVEFETNRKQFIGRGRSVHHPIALEPNAKLSGDSGPVLDPIGSLRTKVSLAPGETQDVFFMMGAAQGRESIEKLISAIDSADVANEFFADLKDSDAGSNGDAIQWIAHPTHNRQDSRLHVAEAHQTYLPAAAVV